MNLEKTLKYIDDNFEKLYSEKSKSNTRIDIENSFMGVIFDWDFSTKDTVLKLEWFPHQYKYSIIIELYSETEFILNTWNSRSYLWYEDFIIDFDIERGYFDCLDTVYPMASNFKFKYLKILKSISAKYMMKKGIKQMR
ncbi:hypothetical protein SEPL_502 [Salmonella phage SE_PL]|uniref:hypothetical protein n=1 Tax=Salmonella enterica TaxID=28901 RepID=UPI0011638CF1|nr:hypothetical protein 7t3_048 [Salmonella phage 7t3]QIG63115.1 hypothetical protein SEPL_502 [Salmonella phage SE_PL]